MPPGLYMSSRSALAAPGTDRSGTRFGRQAVSGGLFTGGRARPGFKDQALLVVCGIGAAALAWGVFRFLGGWVFPLFTLLAFGSLIAENSRLKSRLRERDADRRDGGER